MNVLQSIPAVVTHEDLSWLVLPEEASATYTNFGDDRDGDASALVARVNADSALNCGHADWRLPTLDELKTLIGTQHGPKSGFYWASATYVGDSYVAWGVGFGSGHFGYGGRGYALNYVRLVRCTH